VPPSIFLDFNLPNAATWFYFSLILTVALFFQFTRLLSLRNLDLLTLFLLVPGFLVLQEAHTLKAAAATLPDPSPERTALQDRADRELVVAYAWLIAGTGYWFGRALVDLALVRRPPIAPNLNPYGLGWLGLALFFCLTAVAVRRTADPPTVQQQVGARPAAITQVQAGFTTAVEKAQPGGPASPEDVRFWVERCLAMVCHLAVVLALLMIGVKHFNDATAGMAAGTLYLLLPYTAFHIGQLHHVWPTAFVLWGLFCYRRPVLSGWLLGLAAGSALVPLLLFPLWFGFYSRRGAGRFGAAFLGAAAVSIGVTTLILWWDGRFGNSLAAALNLAEWQPWRRSVAESLWTGVHGAYRLPVFVVYVGFIAAVTVWPSPKNLSHLIALSAAVLMGVQFWHADRGGVYVLWYLPLVLLMVLRPNLSAHEPPVPAPGSGFVVRWAKAGWRRLRHRRAAPPPTELAV
jgi:hypothetical protein